MAKRVDFLELMFPPSPEEARKARSNQVNEALRAAAGHGPAPDPEAPTPTAREIAASDSEAPLPTEPPKRLLDTPSIEQIRARMEDQAKKAAAKRGAKRG